MGKSWLDIYEVEASAENGNHAHDDTQDSCEPKSCVFYSYCQGAYVRPTNYVIVEVIKYKVCYQAAPYCYVIKDSPIRCI